MEKNIEYKLKPPCKLIGENGNVFNIIARVSRTLKDYDMPEQAKEFQHKAMNECKSYDEVLQLVMDYVTIE